MSGFTINPEMSLEEGQALYQSAYQQAHAVLLTKGVQCPQPPITSGPGGAQVPYRGELPRDLTALTDQQLGMYMGLLTEWGNYIMFQFAESECELLLAKEELSLVNCKLRLLYLKDPDDKKRSNPERDDYVGGDRRYLEVNSRYIYCQAKHNYLKVMVKAAEASYAAVSRRVTQRGQEIEKQGRNGNVGAGGNLPAGSFFGGPRR
jgi:hypothetical protein